LRRLNQSEERTPMERYIGLDVHQQSTTMVVVGPSGKRLKTTVIETTGADLIDAVRSVRGTRYLCLEEGTQSDWLAELLQPHVQELVVFMPDRKGGQKDDERDAWDAAEKLRIGGLKKKVFKPAGVLLGLRAAVRAYVRVLDDVVRTKNRLRGLYRSRGIQPPAAETYEASTRKEWEAKLPEPLRAAARLLGAELDALEELRAEAESRLLDEGKQHPIVKRLTTAPAIGSVRAAEIVATVVTPHRFRTKRQFWSYCGLGIVMRSSADWRRDPDGKLVKMRTYQARGLNGNRNALLKLVFKGAAHQVCTQMTAHPLHAHFVRLVDNGTKVNLAKLTIARQLAATVLAMWKHQEDYDPARHR
jgi:transposase